MKTKYKLILLDLKKLTFTEKISIILTISQLITGISSIYIATMVFQAQYVLERHQVELSQREFDLKADKEAQAKVIESASEWFRYTFKE